MLYKKICDQLDFFSGKASDNVRQLAFAGIAVIWLFKQDVSGQPHVPASYKWPAILLVLTLLFDFLQYGVATGAWWLQERRLHGQAKQEATAQNKPIDDVNVPVRKSIHRSYEVFFPLKIVTVAVAYVWLLHNMIALVR